MRIQELLLILEILIKLLFNKIRIFYWKLSYWNVIQLMSYYW